VERLNVKKEYIVLMYRDLTRSKLQINLIASNPKEAREIAQLQESMKGWECVGCKLKKSLDK
jgi:hypothetical protein